MFKHCKKTCNFCSSASSSKICNAVDKLGSCCKLAKDVGCEGTKVANWVAKNCEISCGKCGKNDHCKDPEEVICSDKSGKQCKGWAKRGYCETISGMAENCEKSCGKCGRN